MNKPGEKKKPYVPGGGGYNGGTQTNQSSSSYYKGQQQNRNGYANYQNQDKYEKRNENGQFLQRRDELNGEEKEPYQRIGGNRQGLGGSLDRPKKKGLGKNKFHQVYFEMMQNRNSGISEQNQNEWLRDLHTQFPQIFIREHLTPIFVDKTYCEEFRVSDAFEKLDKKKGNIGSSSSSQPQPQQFIRQEMNENPRDQRGRNQNLTDTQQRQDSEDSENPIWEVNEDNFEFEFKVFDKEKYVQDMENLKNQKTTNQYRSIYPPQKIEVQPISKKEENPVIFGEGAFSVQDFFSRIGDSSQIQANMESQVTQNNILAQEDVHPQKNDNPNPLGKGSFSVQEFFARIDGSKANVDDKQFEKNTQTKEDADYQLEYEDIDMKLERLARESEKTNEQPNLVEVNQIEEQNNNNSSEGIQDEKEKASPTLQPLQIQLDTLVQNEFQDEQEEDEEEDEEDNEETFSNQPKPVVADNLSTQEDQKTAFTDNFVLNSNPFEISINKHNFGIDASNNESENQQYQNNTQSFSSGLFSQSGLSFGSQNQNVLAYHSQGLLYPNQSNPFGTQRQGYSQDGEEQNNNEDDDNDEFEGQEDRYQLEELMMGQDNYQGKQEDMCASFLPMSEQDRLKIDEKKRENDRRIAELMSYKEEENNNFFQSVAYLLQINPNKPIWVYIDQKNVQQGPFDSLQMDKWKDHFTDTKVSYNKVLYWISYKDLTLYNKLYFQRIQEFEASPQQSDTSAASNDLEKKQMYAQQQLQSQIQRNQYIPPAQQQPFHLPQPLVLSNLLSQQPVFLNQQQQSFNQLQMDIQQKQLSNSQAIFDIMNGSASSNEVDRLNKQLILNNPNYKLQNIQQQFQHQQQQLQHLQYQQQFHHQYHHRQQQQQQQHPQQELHQQQWPHMNKFENMMFQQKMNTQQKSKKKLQFNQGQQGVNVPLSLPGSSQGQVNRNIGGFNQSNLNIPPTQLADQYQSYQVVQQQASQQMDYKKTSYKNNSQMNSSTQRQNANDASNSNNPNYNNPDNLNNISKKNIQNPNAKQNQSQNYINPNVHNRNEYQRNRDQHVYQEHPINSNQKNNNNLNQGQKSSIPASNTGQRKQPGFITSTTENFPKNNNRTPKTFISDNDFPPLS